MSDEFDKEAEREKLREKYEHDQQRRADTQRMSELLLQGATMTDSHCDDCGDPIFRYEGQEFCPTCQSAADADGSTDGAAPDTNGADAPPTDDASSTEEAPPSGPDDASSIDRSPTGASRPRESSAGTPNPSSSPGDAAERRPNDPAGDDDDPATGSAPSRRESRIDRAADTPCAALADAVVTLARDAATTDDPRRARDLLGAAREAAEALAALDGHAD
jgi:uncharacterized Zn finger protein (UPF0148 family)